MPLRIRQKPYPRYGRYQRYKRQLRQDFEYRCAYCGIHEAEWGGYRHFQIGHFRPKKLFPWLQAEYTNLLYSCDICSCYKRSDWPVDTPTPDQRGYLNPCDYDHNEYFEVREDGTIQGRAAAAKYMIEALHLNRIQLKQLRVKRQREEQIHREFIHLFEEVKAKVSTLDGASAHERVLRKLLVQMTSIYRQHLNNIWTSRWKPPYEPSGV
jgi:uncharacterized protein (TIGR02646 family)